MYHDDPETVDPQKLRISRGINVSSNTKVSGEVE